jgi:hypothetical protein
VKKIGASSFFVSEIEANGAGRQMPLLLVAKRQVWDGGQNRKKKNVSALSSKVRRKRTKKTTTLRTVFAGEGGEIQQDFRV